MQAQLNWHRHHRIRIKPAARSNKVGPIFWSLIGSKVFEIIDGNQIRYYLFLILLLFNFLCSHILVFLWLYQEIRSGNLCTIL